MGKLWFKVPRHARILPRSRRRPRRAPQALRNRPRRQDLRGARYHRIPGPPDGRITPLEIVGFWRPDYLHRKLDKLRRDLVVAVSRDLNVSEEDFEDVPGPVFFFKNRIQPKDVIERLDAIRLEDCVKY